MKIQVTPSYVLLAMYLAQTAAAAPTGNLRGQAIELSDGLEKRLTDKFDDVGTTSKVIKNAVTHGEIDRTLGRIDEQLAELNKIGREWEGESKVKKLITYPINAAKQAVVAPFSKAKQAVGAVGDKIKLAAGYGRMPEMPKPSASSRIPKKRKGKKKANPLAIKDKPSHKRPGKAPKGESSSKAVVPRSPDSASELDKRLSGGPQRILPLPDFSDVIQSLRGHANTLYKQAVAGPNEMKQLSPKVKKALKQLGANVDKPIKVPKGQTFEAGPSSGTRSKVKQKLAELKAESKPRTKRPGRKARWTKAGRKVKQIADALDKRMIDKSSLAFGEINRVLGHMDESLDTLRKMREDPSWFPGKEALIRGGPRAIAEARRLEFGPRRPERPQRVPRPRKPYQHPWVKAKEAEDKVAAAKEKAVAIGKKVSKVTKQLGGDPKKAGKLPKGHTFDAGPSYNTRNKVKAKLAEPPKKGRPLGVKNKAWAKRPGNPIGFSRPPHWRTRKGKAPAEPAAE